MYEHLGTWTRDGFRVDLWDGGKTDSYGKTVLRYALAIIPEDLETRPIIFDGEDFAVSPLTAIDSDEAVAALLSFFSAYGESIRYGGDDADVPAFTPRQREALANESDSLSMWALDLEGE
jgi:hypothetical protein